MNPVSVRLDDNLRERLRNLGSRYGLKETSVIRMIITRVFTAADERAKKGKESNILEFPFEFLMAAEKPEKRKD